MSIASAAVLRSAGGSAGYAEIPTLDGSSASGSARSSSSVEANGTVSTRRTRSELSLTLPRTLSSASDLQHLAMAAGGPAPTTPSVMTATTPMLVDSSAQQQQQQAQSNGSGKAAAAKAVLSATKAALASRTRSTTRSLLRRLGLLPRSDGSSKGSAAAADKSGLPAMNLATAWSKQPPLPPPSPLQLPADLLLQNKGITGQDARRLCAALVGAEGGEPWPDMPRIASLKVGGNELGDEGAEAVAQALLLPERGRPSSLLTLDLGFNDVGDAGAEALARSLRHNATLRTLYLSGNQIGAAGCRALADALSQRASSIMVLHLTGNADIGPEGGSALGQALRRNTTLTTLYVAGCSLGPQGSAALFAGLAYNRSLRFLYASDNSMGDEGAQRLAQALQQQQEQQEGGGALCVLELGFNRITANGLASLFSALRGYRAMQAVHIDNNDCDDRGAEHVAGALPYMPRLQLLDMGFNHLTHAGVASLMRALAGNSSLRSLTLSGNALQTDGARAVAEALALNSALVELRLEHAGIGHTGERLLCGALEQAPFPRLKVLTGVRLGPGLAQRLGGGAAFPPELDGATNEQALEWLRLRRQHCPNGGGAHGVDPRALLLAIMAGEAGWDGGSSSSSTSSSSTSSSKAGGGCVDEPSMMALSTPPLPNFYGRSAGGKTTPPAAPYHSSAAATATAGIPMCGNNPSASARLQQALLPAHVAQGLAECGHLPWDPAELFALHQHFFSPPPKPKAALSPQHRPQYPAAHGQQQLQPQRASGLGARKRDELEEEEEGGSKDPASNGGHRQEHAPLQAPPPLLPPQPFLRVESECLFPPACKKQCVTTTTAIPPGRAPVRMGRYPRLKARVELMLKGGVTQEHAVLILLRQLRFLEGQQQQTATTSLAPEHIEAILLDTDGLEIVPMGGR